MKTVFLWGDSLSAEKKDAAKLVSWPKQLEQHWCVNMQPHTRGGLAMQEIYIPSWVHGATPSFREPQELCLFLGANDGIKRMDIDNFEARFQQHLDRMMMLKRKSEAAGDELGVTVIMLPRYDWDWKLKPRMKPYWLAQKALLDKYPEVKRTEMPWDKDQMEDPFHPNEHQLTFWACHMAAFWQLPPLN